MGNVLNAHFQGYRAPVHKVEFRKCNSLIYTLLLEPASIFLLSMVVHFQALQ